MMHEDVDALTEWLADQAGIWGGCPASDTDGCTHEGYCRQCWTLTVKKRIHKAVHLEALLERRSTERLR